MRPPRRRLLGKVVGPCCLLVALIASLALASTALAAPTLELTRGSVEPAESIATQLGAVVNNGGSSYFTLHLKPAGGAGCGTNPRADSGATIVISTEFISNEINPVNETRNWTFESAGGYKVCAWVTKDFNGEEVQAFAEASFVVRTPHLALSIGVPPTVLPSQTFQITTTAQTETARQVWEYLMPNTGGCPANANAAARSAGSLGILSYWNVIGGPLTETKNQSLEKPGSYLICAYFQYPNQEAAPELSASAQLSVVPPPPPPPPCVVPSFHRGAKLAVVEQSVRAASCAVGKVHYTPSTSVGRGGVISLGAVAGAKLANGAPVNIVVSAGRPCVVPSVRPGSSVGHVERLLAAGNCGAVIVHAHSRHVRRGRVVRLGSRARSHLYPLSRVPIVVSKGR